MSETNDNTGNNTGGGNATGQDAGGPQVRLERIYLKDASFESPGTPDVFGEEWKPEMQVEIGTRTNSGPGSRFEVVLKATLRAKRPNGKTAYIVEVQQAGLFLVQGLAGDMLQMALATVCPNTLFPYLRESVDALVVKGGFPPLHLAPVNFDALYRQALAQQQQQNAKEEPEAGVRH
ncbi:MAG: protein-export chaperone SecB [Pseudomonadales bacterium]|nr:protein-export chaperone SecB [Pseudomonadales bacterium]